ncbi:MAG: ABC-type transport auxiliary lipoprotein family protein [Thiomonas sp.]|nr:ABC-type transport auxiliary lipoprotein family protein [Thiomonas sp.]
MTASFAPRLRRGALAAFLGLGSLALAACALPVNRQPVQQSYRLTAPDIRTAPLPQPTVIQLLPVRAAAGFQSSAMMYSRSPDTLETYRDSRWLAAPAQLVGEAIARTLSRQPWVSAVQRQAVLVNAPWALHCSLNRLEHDVHGDLGSVHLDLVCELANQRTSRIAAHWHFDGSQAIKLNDAAHFAQGAQTLLDQALKGIVDHPRAAVAQSSGEAGQPRESN